MKLSRADNPERLIPVIPNDILLGLVWNCNISIEARVGPNGWEYLAISSGGQKFWLDGICKRQGMDKNIDDLFVFAQKYKPLSVGIEVTGQQEGFIPWIKSEMVDRKSTRLNSSHSAKSRMPSSA